MDINLLTAIIGGVSGLVGAIVGAIATILATRQAYYYQQKQQEDELRKNLIEGYLFQLSETVYSLSRRKMNIEKNFGRGAMTAEYLLNTSLYILASLWAYERILLSDGIYHELDKIEPGSGAQLMGFLLEHMNVMGIDFYSRIALAEMATVSEGDHHQVLPFIEFTHRLKDETWLALLQPITDWLLRESELDPNDAIPALEKHIDHLLKVIDSSESYSSLVKTAL